jgi:glycosyltransferase involved in cell wall biosynthesis
LSRICAVIPAYNAAWSIGRVVESAARRVDTVVVVDDGSADETAETAGAAGAVVITHEVNTGKGGAVRTGLDWACDEGYEAVVLLDADAQHDPEEIPRFIECYQRTGADFIIGTRMLDRGDMPLDRALTNFVTSMITSCVAGVRVSDSQSGYRLMKCATAARLCARGSRFESETEVIIMAARRGYVIREVPVTTIYGEEKSNINPLADTCRFVLMIARLIFSSRGSHGVR